MKKITTFFIFLGIVNLLFAQKEFTISGYIEDANSREKLIESNVFDLKSSQGTVANNYGFFSLTLPQDSVSLRFSYTGYQTREFKILLNKDIRMDVRLSPSVQLREVEIVGSKVERIEQETQMSRIVVPIEQIKKIPALLGEVDVLKTLQLLPGVQSGGEGQNGLYVRGGSPDQNLILLDGVPVYKVSHLLGFFSVFNADAINNVTLIKGGFPARYGGRLSSVIDINMKEGNLQKFHGEGSIGLISSKLTLEGPIWKEKASFIVSARRTYVDLILKPLISATQNTSTQKTNLSLYFYDLNAKVNYKINDDHRIFLSAYTGKDVLGVSNRTNNPTNNDYDTNTGGTDWGNVTAALRWNFVINKKMFSNTTLTYSQYGFNFLAGFENKSGANTTSFSAKYISGIQDWGGKYDFDYIPNPHHYIRAGVGVTHHTYNPGAFQFNTQVTNVNIDTVVGSTKSRSVESTIYLEDDIKYGAFRANLGVHASNFAVDGIAYQSVQPRIGLNYLLNNSVAIKGSFTTMTQFINLLTNESLSLPTDLWVPSTAKIKPQQSWQAAAGIAKTIQDEYELSIEAYYKEMKKVISYKEGADFIGTSTNWQDKVTQGNGKAYGLEFFVQKKKGRLTGWVGYTLS